MRFSELVYRIYKANINRQYLGFKYSLLTSAVKGSISTPDFAEPFNQKNVKKKCLYEYTLYLPENITNIATSLVLISDWKLWEK